MAERDASLTLEAQELLDAIEDAVIATDDALRVLAMNPAAERLYGVAAGVAVGRPLWAVVEAESAIAAAVRVGLERVGRWRGRCVQRGAGGPVEVDWAVRRWDGHGYLARAVVLDPWLREVEERFDAQRRLLEELVEAVPGVAFRYVVAPEGRRALSYVGGQARALFGIEPSDAREAAALAARIHPEDREAFERTLNEAEARRGAWQWEGRFEHGDGHYLWLSVRATATPHDEVWVYSGVALDVTKHREAEAQLAASEKRYRRLFDSLHDPVLVANPEGSIVDVNQAACARLGYTRDEMLHLKTGDIGGARPRDLDLLLKEIDARGFAAYETLHRTKDGAEIPVEVRVTFFDDAMGRGFLGVARDITERRRMMDALKKSEQHHKLIAELTSDYVFHLAMTPAGPVMDFVTENYQKITGRSMDEVKTVPSWDSVVHHDDLPKLRAALATVMQHDETVEVDVRTTAQDGKRYVRVTARAERDPTTGQVLGVVGAVKDISERVRAEEARLQLENQLQQALKMEAVGRLAGGVAHDFNNQLTAIAGNVALALLDVEPGDPLASLLHDIQAAAESASSLTRQLLAFSRRQLIEPKIVDLNDLIAGVQKMLRRLIGEQIELVTRGGAELGAVKVDPGQFEQILVNLAINARDAMPRGGRLLIATENAHLDADRCRPHPHVEAGDFVKLIVSDTGLGMTDEVKRHLFEPFFTTKPKGEGTGLGLATIYGTVRQAGGLIEVSSLPGRGATFEIYLPRIGEAASPIERARAANLPRGTETVLVVEDEPGVRRLAVKILKRLGYEVLEASHGAEALALVEQRPTGLDLVMSDVVMPGMSGRELAERLRELRPELGVLLSSGYNEDFTRPDALGAGMAFLPKPYSPETLAVKLREVLDARRGAGR